MLSSIPITANEEPRSFMVPKDNFITDRPVAPPNSLQVNYTHHATRTNDSREGQLVQVLTKCTAKTDIRLASSITV